MCFDHINHTFPLLLDLSHFPAHTNLSLLFKYRANFYAYIHLTGVVCLPVATV